MVLVHPAQFIGETQALLEEIQQDLAVFLEAIRDSENDQGKRLFCAFRSSLLPSQGAEENGGLQGLAVTLRLDEVPKRREGLAAEGVHRQEARFGAISGPKRVRMDMRERGEMEVPMGHPARSVGLVCRCGQPLAKFAPEAGPADGEVACSACGRVYRVRDAEVTEPDLQP